MKYHELRSAKGVAVVAAFFCVLFGGISYRVFSDEGISVSATVWPLSKPPVVRSVSPSLPVITVARSSSQSVSLAVEDPDSAGGDLAYTVSVSTGAVVPHNGLAPVGADKSARIDFTYYSPSYKARLVPVTVTIDDQSWAPVTVKTVDIYVY